MRPLTDDEKRMLRLILAGKSLSKVSRIMNMNPPAVLRRLKGLRADINSEEGADHDNGSGTPPK